LYSLLASDQTASDLDQTSADADHGAADSDQATAAQDALLSTADQEASDRDQKASDLELAGSHVTPASERAHNVARDERRQNTADRARAAVVRTHTATERFAWADARDENSRLRDLAAEARDRMAAARDNAEFEVGGPLAKARAQAAADRAKAASDREQAAADRAQAAIDREHARAALRDAHLDELTGVHRRGMGSHELEREIDRARRGTGRLVLAFVDVDDLKAFNDRHGHAAGDALLVDVVAAMRSRLRSYDPVIRFGGDEFLCALGDADVADAQRRFDEIQRALGQLHPGCSVSVGFAQLRDGDTADALTSRGDEALYEVKRGRRATLAPTGGAGERARTLVDRVRRALLRGGAGE
jgi:diguanylate cyclase (GGDEF)-like protein